MHMPAAVSPRPQTRPVPDLGAGLGLLLRGAVLVVRRGRLFGLGLVPPLITSVIFITLFVVAVWLSQSVAVLLTPFAEGWDIVGPLRALVAALVVLASGLLLVLLFSATTLAVGAPLYERISRSVDEQSGTFLLLPNERPIAALVRTVRHLLAVLSLTVLVALGLVAIGVIPLVGGILATVGSALFGGWMTALEMTSTPADVRGIRRLRARVTLLRRNPWLVLGFGIPTFFLLSIPVVSLVIFPIASAGGTLLTRRLVGDDLP